MPYRSVFWQCSPTKSVSEECLRRLSYESVLQEYLTRASPKWAFQKVPKNCRWQKCGTRVSQKSQKSVSKRLHTTVPKTGVSTECLINMSRNGLCFRREQLTRASKKTVSEYVRHRKVLKRMTCARMFWESVLQECLTRVFHKIVFKEGLTQLPIP